MNTPESRFGDPRYLRVARLRQELRWSRAHTRWMKRFATGLGALVTLGAAGLWWVTTGAWI